MNTKEIFDSITEAAKAYDIHRKGIGRCCCGQTTYSGINKLTNEPLVWRYLDNYDENEVIDWERIKTIAEIRTKCDKPKN